MPKFDPRWLQGHPGNITRACKQAIARAHNAGLVCTSTTDGHHATTSLHYPKPPGRRKGHAVDVAPLNTLTHEERLHRLRSFQKAELARGPGRYDELFGPTNGDCVKNGVRITLANHSALEDQHDNHDHIAPGSRVRRGLRRANPVQFSRDVQLARRAKKHGAQFSLRIVREARLAGIPISLGFALVEQETGFRNVWGHDGHPNGATDGLGGREVRKADYLAYRKRRGAKGEGGMQGVGPCQLTWYSFQDDADRLGGCWVPRYNIRVAFSRLALLIRAFGERDALRRYNGVGPAASRYAKSVEKRQDVWHERLA